MDPKEKSKPEKPEESMQEEENKGFFEIDEAEEWEDDDIEEEEVEEKIREHKLKSMREKRKGEIFKRKK